MEKYLQEAFKAFEELNEDVFDISINDGLEKAKEFEDEPVWDDRENQIIIDPLAKTEEELEKDYIGKAILQCEICQSMIYKNPDEVIIDEETELANIDEACPFCQSEDGFKVIGEIKEFCDDEECEEKHEEEEAEESEEEFEEPVEDEEELDESIKTRKKVRIKEEREEELDEAKRPLKRSGLSNSEKIKRTLAKISESTERDRIDADADDKKEIAKKKFAKAEDDADSDRDYKLNKKGLKEEKEKKPKKKSQYDELYDFIIKINATPGASRLDGYDLHVELKDEKQIKKLEDKLNAMKITPKTRKAGKYTVYDIKASEALKEDFNKVDIETDTQRMSMESDESGKVTVTTEPKTPEIDLEAGTEVIAPVSDEVKAEFKSSEEVAEEEPEEIDYDFDEFEEKDFDSLGEGFLRKVYENVKSFKTTEGRLDGNNLMFEGLITFKSGKQAKTNFVFEAYKATKTGKLKFIGENKQFAKGKKSFTLSGKVDGKKLVCESLTYNYCAKAQDGNSKRLYGTIRK